MQNTNSRTSRRTGVVIATATTLAFGLIAAVSTQLHQRLGAIVIAAACATMGALALRATSSEGQARWLVIPMCLGVLILNAGNPGIALAICVAIVTAMFSSKSISVRSSNNAENVTSDS